MSILLMKLSIILIGFCNVVLIKYYKEKRKQKIDKILHDENATLKDDEYEFYKYEQNNSFINEFTLVAVYVVMYIIFSFMKFSDASQLILAITTNYMVVFLFNIAFFKGEIRKTPEYKIANEKHLKEIDKDKEENKVTSSTMYEKLFDKKENLSIELYLFENKKDSLENFIINYVFMAYVIFYLIINAIYYIFLN